MWVEREQAGVDSCRRGQTTSALFGFNRCRMDAVLVWRVRFWVAAAAVLFIATGHGQRPETLAQPANKAPLEKASAVCAGVDGQTAGRCAATTRIKEASVTRRSAETRL